MSATAETWKHPLLRIARMRVHSAPAEIVVPAREDTCDSTLLSLAQQIFFPARDVRRTRVLLAATGTETKLPPLAEELGKAVSKLTHARVALVENSAIVSEPEVLQDLDFTGACEHWVECGSQIAERLWRIPGFLFSERVTPDRSPNPEALPFEYLIFASQVTDRMFPRFCNESQGVVLALTANHTRKESALQAQRIVQQCNGTLLGTVLLGRKFPIPESIYRRL